MAILELKNVHTYYGNIHALKGINLTVEEGEVVTLIGSNGAGKTTTLRTIQGLLKPREGSIKLNGEELTKLPPHDVVKRGVSQSPEGRLVFPRMSVKENLEMGAFQRNDKDGIAADMEKVFGLFPRMKERINQRAGTLSGGEQQMLAMGRALMAKPRVLLLDEPSMGLAPILVDLIFDIIRELHHQKTTILLVEQNARIALSVADRGYVLETGEIVLSGNAKDLAHNPEVEAAYLGGKAH
ncbi:MAG: ABC transporter ATP-binding protein [Chloroflexi bacterium]|jgi:branched-chain amino acid transport system ATP-binding protein|nr:ABC transporter ATP-binding protein [Chloroflexota bacterium]